MIKKKNVNKRALAFLMLALFTSFQARAKSMSFHDFNFTAIEGGILSTKDFSGKAVLVVNTASFCGFTNQYSALQELWEKYRDQGLVVLGVPSNDFGSQEPGSENKIKKFCETNFSINFPMTSKAKVKGKDAHPFFIWARERVGVVGSPKWNFHKYLIGPDGQLVDWFASTTKPDSIKVKKAIEKALP